MIQCDGIFVQQGGDGIDADFASHTIYLHNLTDYNVGVSLFYCTVEEIGTYSIRYVENSDHTLIEHDTQVASASNVLDGILIVFATNLSNGDNIYIRGVEYSSTPYPNDDESIGSTKTTLFVLEEPDAEIIITSE